MPELVAVEFDPFKSGGTPDDFRARYGGAAEKAGKALGVDPNVLLGQWGLETGWGKSVIPGTNNLGNIKDFSGSGTAATDNMTGSRDKYRKYDTPEAFADDFTSLIQRKYPGAVGAKTPEDFAKALKSGGYAEDPGYVTKVTQAAKMATPKGLLQRGVEAIIPSAEAAELPKQPELVLVDFDPFAKKAGAPAAAAPAQPKVTDTIGGKALRALGGALLGPTQVIGDALTGGQFSKDTAAGLVRGAGSIGATLAAPYDYAMDAINGDRGKNLSSLVTGKELPSRNAERRASMDNALQSMGADPSSYAYGASKLGAEIAGTSGVGGVVAAPLRALASSSAVARNAPAVANALQKVATSAETGGMSVGPGGSMVGNALARAAGGAISAGAQGGLVGPALAGTSALIGAAAGPVVSTVARLGGGVAGGVRAIRDTMTEAGQQRIAENILRLSATNPEAAAAAMAAAKPVVPGSLPTIGQSAADPGLAQLERTLLNNPATAPGLQARYAQQQAARGSAIDEVAATGPNSGSYYDDIQEGRRVFAKEDYDAARLAGIDPEVAASMQPEIASLMSRPSIKAATADAKRLAAETGEEITDMGSIQGMDWMRKALANQISKAKASGASEDVRALTQTYDDLGKTLEQLSPKYAEANRNYAQMSKQINAMDVARDLEGRYSPAAAQYGLSARENGAAYMKALKAAQDSVKKATGRDQAIGDVMSTADISKLENVARDLARKQYAQEAGRAVGSPTAQNMLSQNFIQNVMEGAGLPASAAIENALLNSLLRPLEFAGRIAEPKVTNRLAELATNPEAAANALRFVPKSDRIVSKSVGRAAPNALRGRSD
jgi:hypothetical protein